ncbi:MAG: methyltransferase domain-containing protein [Gemmatimonadales bacterium]
MHSIEESAKRIFGERAASYTISAAHADEHVLARIVELARPRPDWTALDIATGTGHTALAVAPHVASVIGFDLTPEMLAEADKLRAARGVSNVTFREGDVHALPFPDASFDLVTSRRAPHHFSNITLALGEMKRVLRPGGRLLIDDRSVPEDDFVDACMNELDRYHDESHVRQYRPSEWQAMLGQAGFAVELAELYTKHRPLASLTDDVGEANVRKIHARLEALNEQQRRALHLTTMNGELYINHWYVLLSATSPL